LNHSASAMVPSIQALIVILKIKMVRPRRTGKGSEPEPKPKITFKKMAKDIQKVISVRPQYQVNRGAVKLDSGLAVKYLASAVFDTAGTDSAGVANTTVASHGTGVYIPTKAIITKAWVDVITTFTTASADAGTIALTLQSAGDITAAIAVSAAGDVWDAGLHGTIVGTPALDGNARTAIAGGAAEAAAMFKLTAEREIVVTVGGQVLTAGKMNIFVEYIISA
jgi:hypothetical protein